MKKALDKWDPEELAGIFRQAGSVALEYYDNPPAELKDDRSVVTAADRTIENIFAEICDREKENIYLIGEETIEKHSIRYIESALQSDCCWVLDPIDGTAPYSAHLDIWGISLAFMQKGVIREGAVYFPAADQLLITYQGKVLQRRLLQDAPWSVFTPKASFLGDAGHIAIGQKPAHEWGFSGKNQLFAWSSCVGSLYSLLCGRVIAYCGDFKLWDIAGMLPILHNLNYPILSTAGSHEPLSPDLSDNMFTLDMSDKRRWKVCNPVIAAADRTAALNILEQFHTLQKESLI
ncbi:MAG: hypothetical protein J6S19_01040 [Lentisphaeria bacterium]|nr:hypothetical protein [Lentisphaeria bacterium]